MTKIKLKSTYAKSVIVLLVIALQGVNCALAAQPNTTSAQTITLSISPEQCVALHQGQVCYQNISFDWSANKPNHYCLYAESVKSPIHCWSANTKGSFAYDFQSNQSVIYYLRLANSQQNLASVKMTVAWVYGNKKRRRASWRLF